MNLVKIWRAMGSPVAGVIAVVVIGLVLFPIFSQSKTSGPNPCISCLKQSGLGVILYSADYDNNLPKSRWMDLALPYVKTTAVYHCNLVEKGQFGYAYNSSLAGLDASSLKHAERDPMLFDSEIVSWNAQSPLTTLAMRHGSGDGGNYVCADSGAHFLQAPNLQQVIADSAEPTAKRTRRSKKGH